MAFSLTGCSKKVLVTFDATGGVVTTITAEYKTNNNYTLPTPIREGYNFVCWLNGENEIPNQGVWSIDKDVTLKAKWSVKSYNITFNANDGEIGVTNLDVTYDKEVELPVPTRKGYEFKGWEYNGKTITDKVWKIDGENINLKAKWSIIDYVVTFDLNGGQFSGGFENMQSTIVNYGKDYDFEKFNPIKPSAFASSVDFKYWRLEDGTEVPPVGTWQYTENVKLIAVWDTVWADTEI
jgi:uncharacterized repeat protein (TIGR02543 family)